MLDKIRTSLFIPSEIGKYAKDSLWKALVYAFIISLVCVMPFFLMCLQTQEVSVDIKDMIKSHLLGEELFNDDMRIEDGKLTGGGKAIVTFPELALFSVYVNTPVPTSNQISVAMVEDRVLIICSGALVFEYSYEELSLNGLVLSDLQNENESINFDAYSRINNAIDIIVMDLKPIWIPIFTILYFIYRICEYIFYALIIAIAYRIMVGVKFGTIFILSIYGLTIFEVGSLICTLFHFGFGSIIFMLVSAFYMVKAVNGLYDNNISNSNGQE